MSYIKDILHVVWLLYTVYTVYNIYCFRHRSSQETVRVLTLLDTQLHSLHSCLHCLHQCVDDRHDRDDQVCVGGRTAPRDWGAWPGGQPGIHCRPPVQEYWLETVILSGLYRAWLDFLDPNNWQCFLCLILYNYYLVLLLLFTIVNLQNRLVMSLFNCK